MVKVIETADVLVEFPESRKRWNLNSHCLKLATEEEESAFNSRTSSSSFGSLDRDHTWSHNYSLDDPNIGILLSGAATGDVNTVRAYVNSYPNSVRQNLVVDMVSARTCTCILRLCDVILNKFPGHLIGTHVCNNHTHTC